jgi:phosphomevalonate kinase
VNSVTVTVPGKAVLSGEYAVLRKAPAIAVAINCRALARIVRTEQEFHSVSTPGHAAGQRRFTANDAGEIDWLDELPNQGLRLIEEAWRVCVPAAGERLAVTLDTRDFFAPESGQKLGLGGSAAAMTALIGALACFASQPADVFELARKAHKALQGGLGSGVDIATSFYGGVIEFRTNSKSAPLQHPWPAGLAYRFLWSGTSADTRSRIVKIGSESDSRTDWSSLSSAAEAAASAWAGNDVKDILHVFEHYTNTLRQFSIDHDLGIFDAGHDELRKIAATFGVVYKPCGAGGGDIGIALAADENAVNGFCKTAETFGFASLDISPDPAGISTDVGDMH